MATRAEIDAEIQRRQQQASLRQAVDIEIARRQGPSAQDLANQGIGPIQAGLISAGRGMTGIARAAGLAEPEPPETTAAFQQLQQQRPISTTVGEVAGQTAPFLLPGTAIGAITSLPARVAASAALGVTEGGLIARAEGASGEQQILSGGLGGIISGGFELALPRISRIARQAFRRVTGKEPVSAIIDSAGNPSDEFIDVLRQEGRTFDDVVTQVNEELADEFTKPEELARKAFLESQGVQPTQAQISRTAADFQQQQELAKTSGRVREALEQQEAALTTRFDNAVLDTGGRPVTPTSTVTDALVSKATVLDQQISDLYKQARDVAPGEKNVRFNALVKNLRRLAPTNRRTGGNIEAIVGDLQSKGIVDGKMNIVGKVDVETAEDVRKLMNELFDAQNPFGNGVLRELKGTLDDDVFRAAGEDVFKQGRQAKADFERELTRAKVSKFDSRKANLVRDILENKIDPDRFVDQVVFSKSRRPSDIQQLKDYISTDAAGEQAFNDLRAETLNTIKQRSFIGPEDAQGFKALSRDKLERTLSAIGPEKLRVLFSPEENKFFRDILQVSKLREPVGGTALGRGPSAQAIGRVEEAINKIPILGNIVDIVATDARGRAVLRANPKRIPSPIRQPSAVAPAATGVGVGAIQEEQQQ